MKLVTTVTVRLMSVTVLSLCLFVLPAAPQYPRPTSHPKLPTPLGYVSDYAEILTPQWSSQIRAVCKELEQRTGVEMIVVTLPTVGPSTSVNDYASMLYEGWRIGTTQQQRGILLLTALEEKQAVVVLGRTLLSVVTRQELDTLSSQHFIPMFQRKAFGRHLYQASVQLAAASGNVKLPDQPEKESRTAGFWMNLAVVFGMMYVLWRFIRPEQRHPFQRWRRGEYWSTGQGGFGGNFGGFGGRMNE